MDNRRLSARADAGGNVRAGTFVTIPVLDRAIELTRLNWEILFFVGILLLTAFTRLWELGPRAFHHDESIHAYFSNYFLHTGDYTTTAGFGGGYDPTYHGPFLYHITALSFLLFGTSDATARLMPALFGIVLVGLCWLLRPFIGRVGAMIAALMLLVSPSISYYSRSLRHDIFALTGIMLLFVSILWFMRTHQSRWVYLGAIGLAIAYASHELTFIVAGIFVIALVIAIFLYRYEDVNPVRSAWSALMVQRWTLIGGVLTFAAIYTVLFTNLLTKPLLIFSGIVNGVAYWLGQQSSSGGFGQGRGNQPWFYYLLLMPIYEPLAFFGGIGTMIYMVVRWLRGYPERVVEGDDTDVASQELVDDYGVAVPDIVVMRLFTMAFLVTWCVLAFIAFSIAGERLPWLNMQVALPFSLLTAAGLSKLITSIDWREARKGGGVFVGVALILFIFSVFALIAHLTGNMPPAVGTTAGLQNGMRGVLLFLISVGLLALIGYLAYKMLPGRAIAVAGLTVAIVLLAYGIRSMALVNYRHGDVPNELLVYTQSAPDVPIVADMIQRLSRDETAFDTGRTAQDVTGGHGLAIAIDQGDAVEWPFDWYFRDMRAVTYFNTTAWEQNQANVVAPNQPVILASEATESNANFQNFIKDKYVTQKYVLNWWFPEEAYKVNGQGDLGTALHWLTSNGWKYVLYRDPGMALGSRNFYLHVRSDLAPKTGLAAPQGANQVSGGSTTPPTDQNPAVGAQDVISPTDQTVYGMFDLVSASTGKGISRGQFNLPRGIATAPDGSFYVVDTANNRIQKFDKSGKFLAIIGSGKGSGDGQFQPFSDTATGTGAGGIAVDKAGNIYVADTWNHRIQKFDKSGKFLAKWGSFLNLSDPSAAADSDKDTKFFGPRGVAIGPDGNVYVTDTGNKRVMVYDPNGKFVSKIDSGMSPNKKSPDYAFSQPGEMNEPIGIAVDSTGNIYVADTNNHRIQKFDKSGKPLAQWPIPGGNWDPGSYLEPFLAVDAQGNVYATAPTGGAVLKFSPAGQLVATVKNAGAVTLKTPTGITIGSDGNVYVSDTGLNGEVNMGKIGQ